MNANYRVNEIFTDEETGDVVARCYDLIYDEEFEKMIGQPDDYFGKETASNLLKDSSYDISDEIRSDIENIFSVIEFDQENDYTFDGPQYMNFGEDDDAALGVEDIVEESFSLRESLNRIDLKTNNKYNLLNLYEACNLSENEKRALANIVYDQDDAEVIYDTLNDRYISGEEIGMPERVKDGVIHESKSIEEDLENDLDKIYTFENAHSHPSILDNIKTLERSELVDHITPVTMYDTEVFEMVATDGRVFYLVPSTLSQFDVYDENEELVTSGEFTRSIPAEVLMDKSNLEFIYELVGGEYAGTYTEGQVKALPCFTGKYTADQSDIRAKGGFTSRVELDNKPKLNGYLGPMMGGYRDNKMVLRYETQEVYDRLSESSEKTLKPGDMVHVKPSNKSGRVKSVKGDTVEVEVMGGEDPDRIDTYYLSDLEFQDRIEESLVKNPDQEGPYSKKQIEQDLYWLTDKFTRDDILKCGYKEEAEYAEDILSQHYASVELDKVGSWFQIEFKDALKKDVKESFSSNINLDKVVMDVENQLDDSRLGDKWIEVFPTDDAYPIGNGEYGIRLEITGADEKARKAFFRTKNGRVEVAFVNGSEAMCDDEREIARFIAGEYGLSLNESISEDNNKSILQETARGTNYTVEFFKNTGDYDSISDLKKCYSQRNI